MARKSKRHVIAPGQAVPAPSAPNVAEKAPIHADPAGAGGAGRDLSLTTLKKLLSDVRALNHDLAIEAAMDQAFPKEVLGAADEREAAAPAAVRPAPKQADPGR